MHATTPGGARRLVTNLGVFGLTVAFLLAAIELGLRLSGFSYRLYPQDIEFGRPDPVMLATGFEPDPDVFWVTRDYRQKLERYRAAPPRLLFLGDSCTHLGRYDQALEALVRERRRGALSWGNLGVAGWSSYQGRVQLARDVVPLAPRAVTLYFGWNDHWIGFGIEDKDVAAITRGTPGPLERLRVIQLWTKARLALGGRRAAYPDRVSRVDFAANLRAMVATARAHGIVPLLITAPSSHLEGEEPPELGTRWLRDLGQLVPLHRAYQEIVRAVAAETGSALCDAAAAFEALPRPELERAMMADGIHLSADGDRRLAAQLYDCLDTAGVLDAVVVGGGGDSG